MQLHASVKYDEGYTRFYTPKLRLRQKDMKLQQITCCIAASSAAFEDLNDESLI